MTAQIIREAEAQIRFADGWVGAMPAMLEINGVKWTSVSPEASVAKAASINDDAREICDRLNKP